MRCGQAGDPRIVRDIARTLAQIGDPAGVRVPVGVGDIAGRRAIKSDETAYEAARASSNCTCRIRGTGDPTFPVILTHCAHQPTYSGIRASFHRAHGITIQDDSAVIESDEPASVGAIAPLRRTGGIRLNYLPQRIVADETTCEHVSRHSTAYQRLPKDQVRMVLEIGELPRLERLDSDFAFLREIKRLVLRRDLGIRLVALWRDGAGLVDRAGVIDDGLAIGRQGFRIVPVRTPIFKCIGHKIELLGLPR